MTFYLTTAIPYVNAAPHLGHALEFVQTDAIARYQRLRGREVALVTGADENSLKNVHAAEKAAGMSAAEWQQVDVIIEKNRNLMDLYCTGCGYCMPCPNSVNIPENLKYMNWHKIWGMEEQAKEAYAKFSPDGFWAPYASGKIEGLNAAACIECGECEPKCPQNIPITKQLEEVGIGRILVI